MTFAYQFGHVMLSSNIVLDGLRSVGETVAVVGNAIDFQLKPGPPPLPDTIVYCWPGRYRTRLGRVGDDWVIDSALDGTFVVDRGFSSVRAYSAAPPPHAALADVFARRVLPRIVTARGAVTIHAASVATADGAALLVGSSGAGKSTLTAALAARPEWTLLSDDQSMLWEGTPPLVAPGATGVCLWPDSRAALRIEPRDCVAMPGYDGKVRYHPPGEPTTQGVPLSLIVFLASDAAASAPELTTMNRAEGFILAARQLIAFNPAAPASSERAHLMARLSSIVRDVPMVRLTRPQSYAALPRIAAMLGEALAS